MTKWRIKEKINERKVSTFYVQREVTFLWRTYWSTVQSHSYGDMIDAEFPCFNEAFAYIVDQELLVPEQTKYYEVTEAQIQEYIQNNEQQKLLTA